MRRAARDRHRRIALGGKTAEERLAAMRALAGRGCARDVIGLLDEPPATVGAELRAEIASFLHDDGIAVDLAPYAAGDWFDSMVRTIEGFEEVCDLVGYKFVAFAMIAGLSLRAVNHNTESPADSTVEFSIGGEDAVKEMNIEEFRRSLLVSMGSPDAAEGPARLSRLPTREELSSLVGARYFLLAPLYGIRLSTLYIVDPKEGPAGYDVAFEHAGAMKRRPLASLREELRGLVGKERVREREPSGKFSAEAIASAEKALETGNPGAAIEHLRDWVAFVRNYRVAGGIAQFTEEPEAGFTRGLLLSGRAYRLLRRNRMAEDIMRFSLQILPASAHKPTFFFELAQIMMSEGRYGEAIAPLRRVLAMGLPRSLVSPLLARALLECDRLVGAFLLFGELNREGLLDDESRQWHEEAARRLGDDAVRLIEGIPPARHGEDTRA